MFDFKLDQGQVTILMKGQHKLLQERGLDAFDECASVIIPMRQAMTEQQKADVMVQVRKELADEEKRKGETDGDGDAPPEDGKKKPEGEGPPTDETKGPDK